MLVNLSYLSQYVNEEDDWLKTTYFFKELIYSLHKTLVGVDDVV